MGTFGKPRAALYNRVSTGAQNPHLAMGDLELAATQRGYEIGVAVAETGSGARNDRPGLQRVLEAAQRGRVSAVFVSRLDRFGRSSLDLLANIRALTDAGVEFIAVEQGIHVKPHGDPMSRLLLTILSGVAEFERDIIRDRVVEGQRRAKARGVAIGRPRQLRPEPSEVRALRAQGWSWSAVALKLGCTVATARRRAVNAVPGSRPEEATRCEPTPIGEMHAR